MLRNDSPITFPIIVNLEKPRQCQAVDLGSTGGAAEELEDSLNRRLQGVTVNRLPESFTVEARCHALELGRNDVAGLTQSSVACCLRPGDLKAIRHGTLLVPLTSAISRGLDRRAPCQSKVRDGMDRQCDRAVGRRGWQLRGLPCAGPYAWRFEPASEDQSLHRRGTRRRNRAILPATSCDVSRIAA